MAESPCRAKSHLHSGVGYLQAKVSNIEALVLKKKKKRKKGNHIYIHDFLPSLSDTLKCQHCSVNTGLSPRINSGAAVCTGKEGCQYIDQSQTYELKWMSLWLQLCVGPFVLSHYFIWDSLRESHVDGCQGGGGERLGGADHLGDPFRASLYI